MELLLGFFLCFGFVFFLQNLGQGKNHQSVSYLRWHSDKLTIILLPPFFLGCLCCLILSFFKIHLELSLGVWLFFSFFFTKIGERKKTHHSISYIKRRFNKPTITLLPPIFFFKGARADLQFLKKWMERWWFFFLHNVGRGKNHQSEIPN